MTFRNCAAWGLRCFNGQDDFYPLADGGGYCNRWAEDEIPPKTPDCAATGT